MCFFLRLKPGETYGDQDADDDDMEPAAYIVSNKQSTKGYVTAVFIF